MNELFIAIEEHRNQTLSVLKQNKTYYNYELIEYTTPSKKHNIKYYKWNHPYQGTWEYTEIFTDPLLDFVKTKIPKNTTIIDIGAQVGLMSVLYAQSGNKVIAFEPNPAVYETLLANSSLYPNIIPYNFACSMEEGPLEFHYSDEGLCNGGFATNCKVGVGVTGHIVPIDVYAINACDFLHTYHPNDIDNISLIKIDAEGHDKDILKTLKPIVNKVKPLIITELYAGLVENEVNELLENIKENNYNIFNITKDNTGLGVVELRKEIKSIKDVRVGELCNLLCIPK